MAKRISLREFQQHLTAKLGSMREGASARSLLGVQSGGGADGLWLLDLSDAGEIVPLENSLAPVPLTRRWFAGLANVRGVLYSVVDFAAFRGLDPTPRNSDALLIMIGARHGINSALLVDRALGLRPLDELTTTNDDTATTAVAAWRCGRYRDQQGREWTRLDVPALLADPAFVNVAAQTTKE